MWQRDDPTLRWISFTSCLMAQDFYLPTTPMRIQHLRRALADPDARLRSSVLSHLDRDKFKWACEQLEEELNAVALQDPDPILRTMARHLLER